MGGSNKAIITINYILKYNLAFATIIAKKYLNMDAVWPFEHVYAVICLHGNLDYCG